MELRQLRYLIAVAEESTIIAAAERLHLAQPALSRQIRALERDIGAPLFDRGSRGVTATAAGVASLAAARRIHAALRAAVERAWAASKGLAGTCTIAFGPRPIASGLVARIVTAVHERLPQIDFVVREYAFVRQWEAVRSGEIDIGLGAPPPPRYRDLISETVVEDLFDCAAVSVNHPFANRESVSLADLAGEVFLTWAPSLGPTTDKPVLAAAKAARIKIRARREFEDPYALFTAVRAGQGWALVTSASHAVLQPDAKPVPISDYHLPYPHAIIRRRGTVRPVIETVSAIVRGVMTNDGNGNGDAVRPNDDHHVDEVVLNAIELRQLNYFRAAVDAGSFGRAAEQLGITQPALSRQIRELERLVAVPLLDRKSRGATASEAGRMFREDVGRIVDDVAALPREASRVQRGVHSQCIIGGVPTALVQRMLKTLLSRAESAAPPIEITFVDLPSPKQPDALRTAEIDVGVSHRTPLTVVEEDGIRRFPLADDKLSCALLRADHPLAGKESIDLRELEGFPFLFVDRASHTLLHAQVFGAFAEHSFNPRVDESYGGHQPIWALVASGSGWAIGFESQRAEPPPGTVAVPINRFAVPFSVQALVRDDESRAPVLSVVAMLGEITP